MIERIEVAAFLERIRNFLILDVRSPGEYAQGKIPGAINVPLFTDSERAIIGTIYHQLGKEAAILRGLDICLPNIGSYIRKIRNRIKSEKLLIYCWRGGMRSTIMAEVFCAAGLDVAILEGGYKSYRRQIRADLSKRARIFVLGGPTGSGKTGLLVCLEMLGEQVIDLEKLACHKGSVFGALGQNPQPTNEQFENDLYSIWSKMDFSRPIWIEDESRMIGNITLPDPLLKQMTEGKLIKIELPLSSRIEHLVGEYSGFDKGLLATAILKLQSRLGGANTSLAINALDNGNYEKVAEILLSHYDNAYQYSLEKRKIEKIFRLPLPAGNQKKKAEKLLIFSKNLL